MMLKAVGFDIDGTLYPDSRVWRRSVIFFLSHIRILMAFSRTRKLMRERQEDREEDEIRFFARELRQDEHTAKSIRDKVIYQEWTRCFRNMKIYPGVRESLINLKNSGLKLAALSDFPVGKKLEYFGLADLFDVTMGFPESGRLKPSAEPFLKMARSLDVKPSSILYIGNKLAYDVRGAENAGMYGALIGTSGRNSPPGVKVYPDYWCMTENILTEAVE